MRILVTGKNGQLGHSIQKIVSEDSSNNNNNQNKNGFIFVGRNELDLSSEDNIANYFNGKGKFDIIINCAAYTAVDKAEEEQNLANQVNHLAVAQLAQIAKNQQVKLIHISTDYVFDGASDKPYMETDEANPINIYGRTKLSGEEIIREVMPTDAIIIRTSWVYSEYDNNFVKTMLKLGKERDELNVVSDQMGSPTYATDLAEVILTILNSKGYQEKENPTEVYHYSNEGEVTWYDFAKEIFRLSNINCKVKPITTKQYSTPANRPKNTVINKSKIAKSFNVKISDWRKSLQACIKNIKGDK